jgi:altronate hydrolase
VVSSVNCSAHVCRLIADHFKGEALADYPNIDGVVPIHHKTGCGMGSTGEPVEVLRRVLAGYATHPNMQSTLMVGLGCEANQINDLLAAPKSEAHRAAADHDDPGDRRHAQDGAGRHCAHQGAVAGSEQSEA